MGLARALAVDPKVLLLDEPFGALDARVRAELRLWLRRLHDETHTTTVIVTHDQEEAMEVADEVVVMNRGQHRADRRAARALRPAGQRVRDVLRRAARIASATTGCGRTTSRSCSRPRRAHARRRSSESCISAPRVRCELVADDGTPFTVELTRDQEEQLELDEGAIVWVRPNRATVFTQR